LVEIAPFLPEGARITGITARVFQRESSAAIELRISLAGHQPSLRWAGDLLFDAFLDQPLGEADAANADRAGLRLSAESAEDESGDLRFTGGGCATPVACQYGSADIISLTNCDVQIVATCKDCSCMLSNTPGGTLYQAYFVQWSAAIMGELPPPPDACFYEAMGHISQILSRTGTFCP
jgi:hypothetical protein